MPIRRAPLLYVCACVHDRSVGCDAIEKSKAPAETDDAGVQMKASRSTKEKFLKKCDTILVEPINI